ncbi:MAG: HRDC domain-containing protein [Acidimicrobiia bacterium]|nr:HRDC domain-containing protein [Acidimicrobiia bacterium]MCY4432986.1 HRDC domain-containing protein [bacterium]
MLPEPVVTRRELAAVVADAATADAYAIDTEFHRERTYYPRLALVQIAWHDQLAVIDPLAVPIKPLAELLDGHGLAVLHAAEQDLEVLFHECETRPRQIFDTQIGAGFIGFSSPSLATLHERLLGVELAKEARLSDWFQRPLPDHMLAYAAADVERLLEISDMLQRDLHARGRLKWAEEECELLLERADSGRSPETAWLKLKEVRRMEGRPRALGQAVARWREEYASRLNQPVRHLLSDLGVAVVAQRMPKSIEQLREIRGVEPRNLRKGADKDLLAFLNEIRGADLPIEPASKSSKLDPALKPAVSLITSWAAQHAAELDLDPTLVATRSDIEALLRGDPDCRSLKGWRAEIIAAPVQQLLEGAAAVAFDGQGRLTLEERSGRAISPLKGSR